MRTKGNGIDKLISDIENMELINERIRVFNNEISELINNIDIITKDMNINEISAVLKEKNEDKNYKKESISKKDFEYMLTEIKGHIDQKYNECVNKEIVKDKAVTTEEKEQNSGYGSSQTNGYSFERNGDIYYLDKEGDIYYYNPVDGSNKKYKEIITENKRNIKCERIYYSLINDKNENIILLDKENKNVFRYNIPLCELEQIDDKECLEFICINSVVYMITKEEFIVYRIRNNRKDRVDIRRLINEKDNYVKINIVAETLFIIINEKYLAYNFSLGEIGLSKK